MKRVCIALLKFYKKLLSPLKPYSTCIYYPTCSVYAMEAYETFGFFKGSFLTLRRLLTCTPWGKGGFDPLPYNFKGDIKWTL